MILLTLFLAVFSFLGIVGSEEYNSVPKGAVNHNYDNIYSHESYIIQPRGPQNTYHNHDIYPPPHHNHNGHHYHPPNFNSPNEYPTRTSWNNYPSSNSYGAPKFPPGFQHDPKYHSSTRSPKNIGGGVRTDNPPTTTQVYRNSSVNKIPTEILAKFDELDMDDFLSRYVEGYEETPTLDSRFGSDVQQRSGAIRATNAACMIENTTVPLVNNDNPNVLYVPRCTRIERCNGCCGNQILACQAIEWETVNVQVVKSVYVGGDRLQYIGKEIIPLERHIKCKCDCKVRAEQCGPRQEFIKSECACSCTNTDEEAKCYSDVNRKEWDPDTCTCKCRGLLECSTGTVYDHNECKCKSAPKRRYARYEKPRKNT